MYQHLEPSDYDWRPLRYGHPKLETAVLFLSHGIGFLTLPPCRFEQMLNPVMLEVKKLRTLQRKGGEMDKVKVLEKTRKYLVSLLLWDVALRFRVQA